MDPEASRYSRRAVLGAALGATAVTMAQALGRPLPAQAGADGDVILGTENRSANRTSILIDDANSPTGALLGWTYGSGAGVSANSLRGPGLRTESHSAASPGLISTSFTNWTGIIGASVGASSVEPSGVPATGVYGYAEDGEGVRGETTTTSGIGGRFRAPSGGTGLSVTGKARFDRSGRANVPARKSYVDITVPGGLTSTSLVLATIQGYRAGVAVSSVRPNYPTAGKARIYLTKVASTSASTPVAWFAVG